MSVNKLDFEYVRQSKKGFTVFLNDVIQHITNMPALGLYCFLSTLPPTFNINRRYLSKHFNVGKRKIIDMLAWLKKNNLITYERERFSNGRLGKTGIVVEDGVKFFYSFKNQQHITTVPENHSVEKPQCGKKHTYKRNIKDINNTKRERAHAERASLSTFEPSEHNQKLLKKTSERVGRTEKELMEKFLDIFENNLTQRKLSSFLVNERNLKNNNEKKSPMASRKFWEAEKEQEKKERKMPDNVRAELVKKGFLKNRRN